jgi:antitoxin VapB
VEIFRRGDEIVLREKPANLLPLLDLIAALPKDWKPKGRRKDYPQKRKGL